MSSKSLREVSQNLVDAVFSGELSTFRQNELCAVIPREFTFDLGPVQGVEIGLSETSRCGYKTKEVFQDILEMKTVDMPLFYGILAILSLREGRQNFDEDMTFYINMETNYLGHRTFQDLFLEWDHPDSPFVECPPEFASHVVMQISERSPLPVGKGARCFLVEAHRKGFQFLLDDFGKGAMDPFSDIGKSNLRQFNELPLRFMLKIDRDISCRMQLDEITSLLAKSPVRPYQVILGAYEPYDPVWMEKVAALEDYLARTYNLENLLVSIG